MSFVPWPNIPTPEAILAAQRESAANGVPFKFVFPNSATTSDTWQVIANPTENNNPLVTVYNSDNGRVVVSQGLSSAFKVQDGSGTLLMNIDPSGNTSLPKGQITTAKNTLDNGSGIMTVQGDGISAPLTVSSGAQQVFQIDPQGDAVVYQNIVIQTRDNILGNVFTQNNPTDSITSNSNKTFVKGASPNSNSYPTTQDTSFTFYNNLITPYNSVIMVNQYSLANMLVGVKAGSVSSGQCQVSVTNNTGSPVNCANFSFIILVL